LQTAYALESMLDEVLYCRAAAVGGVARCNAIQNVGASLLAKTVWQATLMLKVMASSRASPLPQGLYVEHK